MKPRLLQWPPKADFIAKVEWNRFESLGFGEMPKARRSPHGGRALGRGQGQSNACVPSRGFPTATPIPARPGTCCAPLKTVQPIPSKPGSPVTFCMYLRHRPGGAGLGRGCATSAQGQPCAPRAGSAPAAALRSHVAYYLDEDCEFTGSAEQGRRHAPQLHAKCAQQTRARARAPAPSAVQPTMPAAGVDHERTERGVNDVADEARASMGPVCFHVTQRFSERSRAAASSCRPHPSDALSIKPARRPRGARGQALDVPGTEPDAREQRELCTVSLLT